MKKLIKFLDAVFNGTTLDIDVKVFTEKANNLFKEGKDVKGYGLSFESNKRSK